MFVVQSRWQNYMERNKILQEKAEALHLPFENLTFSVLRSAWFVYKENKYITFIRVRPQLSGFVFQHFCSVKLLIENDMFLISAHVRL